jgi:hypothetical protein
VLLIIDINSHAINDFGKQTMQIDFLSSIKYGSDRNIYS